MSEIIFNRFVDICPKKKIEDMTDDEILKAVNVAFEIIGYKPINLEEAMDFINKTANVEYLSEYVYFVWEADQ